MAESVRAVDTDLPANGRIASLSAVDVGWRGSLRIGAETGRSLAGEMGLLLGGRINTATTHADGTTTALRLGPDEWLLLATAPVERAIGEAIGANAAGEPHGLVEVTARSVSYRLAGPAVEAVLSSGCPLPLDTATFPPGRATRTLLAKAEVVVWREAADTFRIEVMRSFAPYLVAVLAGAIADKSAIQRLAGSPAQRGNS